LSLPSPNLDDRNFQSIVDDVKRQIGMRCPEWTDHNVSDPGVTLIELFSFMTEMTLFRLNQVPEKHHLKFLDLLGITLEPPEAAQTELRFRLSRWIVDERGGEENELTLRGGETVAATVRTETEDAVEFVTDRDLRMVRPRLKHAIALPKREPGAERETAGTRTFDLPDEPFTAIHGFQIFSPIPAQGDVFYLGFENDISSNVLHLYAEGVNAAATGLNEAYPAQVWEYWQAAAGAWKPLEVTEDRTFGFNRTGYVELAMPSSMSESVVSGSRAFWIRCRYTTLAVDLPPRGPDNRGPDPYQKSPEITYLSVRTVGGTVSATQCAIVRNEVLGVSDGTPGQLFSVKYPPMLALRPGDTVLTGALGETPDDMEGWIPWTRVRDFSSSRPDDRHFTCDELTGEIAFGPALPNPDGTMSAFGAVPEQGQIIGFSSYRTGGGLRGNVRENKVTVLKGSYPYVTSVSNPRPATGGRDREELERAKMRAREVLKIRNRAVTAEDFEFLAQKGSPSVGRARCVQPLRHPAHGRPDLPTPGVVRILIVPALGREIAVPRPHDLRVSPRTVDEVTAYLDERRLLTTVVQVAEPQYVFVSLDIRLVADPRANADDVGRRVQEALNLFLHPLYGGPNGDGWPFRRTLTLADVYAAVGSVRGVAFLLDAKMFVSSLVNADEGILSSETLVSNETGVRLGHDQLLCTRQHNIRVVPISSVGQEDGGGG
jgi:predicted phage baseplate assembly protein